jgi:hypothetical protein
VGTAKHAQQRQHLPVLLLALFYILNTANNRFAGLVPRTWCWAERLMMFYACASQRLLLLAIQSQQRQLCRIGLGWQL